MRKFVIAALVAVSSIGLMAVAPASAKADDGRWRGGRHVHHGHRHHHHRPHWHSGYWHGDHWHRGHWHVPSYRYRTWSPGWYGTSYYSPYPYYVVPRSGLYLNFRF